MSSSLEPRQVSREEIKHWPKLALRLLWKEAPAWIVLVLVSILLVLTLSLVTVALLFSWYATAVLLGILLLEKADHNLGWTEMFANLRRVARAYRAQLFAVALITGGTATLAVLGLALSDAGLSWQKLMDTELQAKGALSKLTSVRASPMTIVGLLMMSGILSFLLRYLVGLPGERVPLESRKAALVNRSTLLGWLGFPSSALIGFLLIMFASPITHLLWPLILAFCYVATREIWIQPTPLEEKEPAGVMAAQASGG